MSLLNHPYNNDTNNNNTVNDDKWCDDDRDLSVIGCSGPKGRSQWTSPEHSEEHRSNNNMHKEILDYLSYFSRHGEDRSLFTDPIFADYKLYDYYLHEYSIISPESRGKKFPALNPVITELLSV